MGKGRQRAQRAQNPNSGLKGLKGLDPGRPASQALPPGLSVELLRSLPPNWLEQLLQWMSRRLCNKAVQVGPPQEGRGGPWADDMAD
jgi:hypothetical protein